MNDDLNNLVRRLDGLERNVSDHAKSITEFFEESSKMDARVRALEKIQHDRRVADAERCAREKAMQKDIVEIEKRLGKIEGGINKVLWTIAGAVMLAFAAFVMRGGLHG